MNDFPGSGPKLPHFTVRHENSTTIRMEGTYRKLMDFSGILYQYLIHVHAKYCKGISLLSGTGVMDNDTHL